ncbi:hypothetical protein CLAIMM_06921 [Cladophialophora immunda]|nr:hypothetical protein CLAIMM_06921 [Cladophialophora immunda]
MSSSPDQHTMKVTVVATQELCIHVGSPTVVAAFPESVLDTILEQLARRGLNLTSIQVASNPDNLCDLQVGQELASAAMKGTQILRQNTVGRLPLQVNADTLDTDSAVFHMFNYNHSLQAWNRFPDNASNKTPLQDKGKAPVTRQLAQKPITWFYDPTPQAELQPTLSNARPSTSNLDVRERMEDDTPTPRRAKDRGMRRKRKKLGTVSPKRATKSGEGARTRAQIEAAKQEEQSQSGKGALKPEKRMVAPIQDRKHFPSRVQRIGMTLALYKFERKRQQDLKKRLTRATESRWKGQPSNLTEDDKIDVITKELDKAFEKM